jgi:hypothetical protein
MKAQELFVWIEAVNVAVMGTKTIGDYEFLASWWHELCNSLWVTDDYAPLKWYVSL